MTINERTSQFLHTVMFVCADVSMCFQYLKPMLFITFETILREGFKCLE